jgi:fimbrial isopeptide formation D2 family protein/LPXTG-motif cell wall-anchored protein
MAVLLASTMMLATGMSAMAQVVVPEHSTQQEGTAQITVANASRGENYCIYKLFAASVTGKENGPIAYTGKVPEELLGFFQADTAGNVRAMGAAVDENGEMSSGLKDALEAWVKTDAAQENKIAEAVSDGSTLHFNNLDYGYYIVTTTQGSSAITVGSTNPTVTLYDKNSTEPSIPEDGKTVNDEKVHIGEPLTYTIKFNTSNYDGAGTGAKQILSYTVKDTLPEFLSYVKLTSITVDNDANLETTEDQVQFSVNDILQYGGNFATDGMITIPWVEQNTNTTSENDTEGNYTSRYKNGAMVVITYTATVTDQAVIDGNGNTNTFTLTWDVGDQETHGGGDKYTDTATVYTYAIALKKVDAKGNALEGAKFQFPFYVKETPSETDGAYIYAGEESGEGLINEITTPEDGIIVVKGVDGDVIAENDNGKYVIYEIEAPKGYNLLTEPVKIAPQMTQQATSTFKTFYLDEQGNITSEETNTTVEYVNEQLSTGIALVVNHAGIELPSTGGIGTTIFAFAGLLLMAGAAGVMIIKKRG